MKHKHQVPMIKVDKEETLHTTKCQDIDFKDYILN